MLISTNIHIHRGQIFLFNFSRNSQMPDYIPRSKVRYYGPLYHGRTTDKKRTTDMMTMTCEIKRDGGRSETVLDS